MFRKLIENPRCMTQRGPDAGDCGASKNEPTRLRSCHRCVLELAGAALRSQALSKESGGTASSQRTKADDGPIPLAIGGVDHLPDHVSVQNFWVNGYGAGRASSGGGSVCCVSVPRKWKPGLKLVVRWEVLNWRDWQSDEYEASVEVEPYDELGELNVHFLKSGRVRAVVSMEAAPWSPTYAGARDPIPRKKPWEVYGEQHRPTMCLNHRVEPAMPCTD